MEAGEENSGSLNLKRQRAPLSDSEDNAIPRSEMNDVQKRRRLEAAAGQENRSPEPSNSGRLAELGTKPDTPMVPSVHSRVQQLTQRREGAPLAQRCLSDPGTDSPSCDKGLGQHLLSEGEFHQRMERFKAPVFQAGPTPSPAALCPRTRSNLVAGIHQKLRGTTTPSSKQASRMRQEREQELNQLPFQPISENAWLKRSSSDPSLAQQGDGDVDMRDGSFTEAPSSGAERPPANTAGERAPCDSEAPAASVELESSREGQLHVERKERNPQQGEELLKEGEHQASAGHEGEQLGSREAESQAVLKLSFSEDQRSSRTSVGEDQNESGDEQSLLGSTSSDESNREGNDEVPKATEESSGFSFAEDERFDHSSYSEEAIEPSTDEECRLWRYPQYKVRREEEASIAEEEEEIGQVKSSRAEQEAGGRDPSDIQERECCSGHVSELKDDESPGTEEHSASCEECNEGAARADSDDFVMRRDQEDADRCTREGDMCHQSQSIQPASMKEEDMDLEQVEASHVADVAQAVDVELQRNTADAAEASAQPADVGTEVQASECLLETEEMEREVVDEGQGVTDRLTEIAHKAEGGERLRKVTFILEPELINDSSLSETGTSVESRAEMSVSDAELSSHDETNTADIIDQMFEEVLEYAGRIEEAGGEDEDAEDHDSGLGAFSGDKEKDRGSVEEEEEEERDESNADELLTFPPSGILSPLSKSVEAVVTPLRLAVSQESNPPSLLLTPEETATPPAESAPLYSIDAYRTQRQSKPAPTIQSLTPAVQRRAPEKSQPQRPENTKDKITALNEEAGKLQTVINQTLQALSCCTDEEHGRGSLEEAEAEKLLLVSCEKRSALLAEVARLREERNSDSGEVAGEDREYVSQQPCRGTVSITNIQLPLKVEFVCSSHGRTGRPSHYFFILIRYGPCNIIATPLATAADAQNGDTISFPTSVTLKDIRSSFEIEVEVYSLSHASGSNCSVDRSTAKARVTPRKLLHTITRSSNKLSTAAPPALNTRRSSNFSLVGSHKITLASLGQSKFPLDKMKLEGKIRRLLGDEFQEKVPFLSPLEGNIYLRLESESHSSVQHQGFLTMFELISGYGVWHRRYFVLEGSSLFYWNHPNDKETKEAEGSISLSNSPSQCVRPVKRDSCARPFTFELASSVPQQQQQQQQDGSQETFAKRWFSADTKQERLDWMEKLNQCLLDFHTWNRTSAARTESQQSVSSGNMRESIL